MTLLFPTPVVYDGNDARFLKRDGARFLDPLAVHGDRGVKVVLAAGPEAPRPSAPGLQAGTFKEWRDPAFWSSFGADGALCYFGFSARRYLPVVGAMRASGIRILLKLDSSFGLHRFPNHATIWFRKCYWVARQHHTSAVALIRATFDMLKWIRGVDSGAMIPYLASFESIAAESPLARDNTCNWLLRHHRPDIAARVIVLPHPVPDDFYFDPTCDKKENLVLAVAADWRNPRKGGAVLAGALDIFLSAHPDWRIAIVGSYSDLVASASPQARNHIATYPPLEALELLPLYKAARIFVTASGSESGPIVAFEALACGCSVVFPPELLQLSWIADVGRGTMSSSRSSVALAAALHLTVTTPKLDASDFSNVSSFPPLHASAILNRLFAAFSNSESRRYSL